MAAGLRAGMAVFAAVITASMLMLPVWLLPPMTGPTGLVVSDDPIGTGLGVAIVAGIAASVVLFVALRHGHLEGL